MDAILFTSYTGHTAAYAKALSQKLQIPAYTLKEAGRHLSRGASVIYLGWIMAGSIKGAAKAAKQDVYKRQDITLLTCKLVN